MNAPRNLTNTANTVTTIAFTYDGEEFEGVLYTDGYIDMHVWGSTPDGDEYDYRYPSSIKEEICNDMNPAKERAFAYAAATALVPLGRPGWWYSRKERDEMGLDPAIGDLMAQIIIDWADL